MTRNEAIKMVKPVAEKCDLTDAELQELIARLERDRMRSPIDATEAKNTLKVVIELANAGAMESR